MVNPNGEDTTDPAGKPSGAERLYRYGFLCHDSSLQRADDASPGALHPGWSRRDIGAYQLWLHPETPCLLDRGPQRTLALIGHAYVQGGGGLPARLAACGHGDDALFALADELAGRFALLEVSTEGCRILHDAIGSRTVFYTTAAPFAVASHAELLARLTGAPLCETIAAFRAGDYFRKRKVRYLPGDVTIFKDIYGLVPNNYFSSGSLSTSRYWPRQDVGQFTMRAFLDHAEDYLRQRMTSFDDLTPLIGITGGIDSRTILAACKATGQAFEGVTWTTGYLKAEERPAVEQQIAYFAMRHAFLRPVRDNGHDVQIIAQRNSGLYRKQSRLVPPMYERYGHRPEIAFVSGYGGEILRGFYNLHRHRLSALRADQMADRYLNHADKGGAAWTDQVRILFEDYCRRGNYDQVRGSGYDPNDIFYWEHRMGMWGAAVLNEYDAATLALVGLNSRPLYAAAFGLPSNERLTKQLLLNLVARLDPELARLPVYPPLTPMPREPSTPKPEAQEQAEAAQPAERRSPEPSGPPIPAARAGAGTSLAHRMRRGIARLLSRQPR